jgi:peptidoglycan/xylan/chitin deacetylase (PgdA/CDA1 family)
MPKMKENDSDSVYFSMAAKVRLVLSAVAILLLFFDARLSVIPLAGFLLLCMAAPFSPRFGFYLPVISRGTSGKKALAITFDDGPDPFTTPLLLKLLLKRQTKATLPKGY